MASSDAPITYRAATLADVESLVALENTCFNYDRMSRRSFRHHIRSEKRDLTLAEQNGVLLGDGLVLYHQGTRFISFDDRLSLDDAGVGVCSAPLACITPILVAQVAN